MDVRILRALKFDPRLERVRDPVILALVAGPAGAVVAAATATGLLFVAGRLPEERLAYEFVLWWMRDWLGVMVAAPLVFAWTYGREIRWTWRRVGEGVALCVVMFLSSQVMFGLWGLFATRNVPVAFVFFPIVGWAGLRFGARGAATVVALISGFAIAIAGMRVGPFSDFPIEFIHALFFAFLSLGSLSGLLLAAIMAERDDAMAKRLLLEEQLRHSQKMEAVGRLAGGIAHDFNNLLTAIIGYTEIVLHGLDPKDERRADAEEIGRAAMRAADLTRQMLAFSRRQVLQPKIIDLNKALTKVEPMLRRVIGEDIVMTVNGRGVNAFVRVDPGQVEQVVMNLVVNARDAMPQGGRLNCRDRRRDARRGGGGRHARRAAGRLRGAVGVGHRRRHAARSASADLRAVLHHQGRWQRAPASACPPPTASCGRATATSRWPASSGSAPRSGSFCRDRKRRRRWRPMAGVEKHAGRHRVHPARRRRFVRAPPVEGAAGAARLFGHRSGVGPRRPRARHRRQPALRSRAL